MSGASEGSKPEGSPPGLSRMPGVDPHDRVLGCLSCQYLMERFPVEEERPSDTAVEEEPPSNTAAENLAIIHGGPNRAETRQRFEFVLPRLAQTCSDAETEVNVADMLAVMNKMIQDAGLGTEEGGLLGFTDAVYSLTMQVGSGGGGRRGMRRALGYVRLAPPGRLRQRAVGQRPRGYRGNLSLTLTLATTPG